MSKSTKRNGRGAQRTKLRIVQDTILKGRRFGDEDFRALISWYDTGEAAKEIDAISLARVDQLATKLGVSVSA